MNQKAKDHAFDQLAGKLRAAHQAQDVYLGIGRHRVTDQHAAFIERDGKKVVAPWRNTREEAEEDLKNTIEEMKASDDRAQFLRIDGPAN